MKLRIMTPLATVFDGDVDEVYLPGENGEFGVLPEHVELISALGSGIVRYSGRDGLKDRLMVSGGVSRITGSDVKVLAHYAEYADSIDAEAARANLRSSEERLSDADLSEEERCSLIATRDREKARLELVEKNSI